MSVARNAGARFVLSILMAFLLQGLVISPDSHAVQGGPSAYERVCQAADKNQITKKESVILKAQLLFDPAQAEKAQEFAPRLGETAVEEDCLTGFYMEVQGVFDQLTTEEKQYLASLNPDLNLIITRREERRLGANLLPVGALPDFGLDQELEGKNCIIHYTLAGANAVPDEAYVKTIKKYMDAAIGGSMTKNFIAAFADGYPDFKGKMHVYLVTMSDNGTWVGSAQTGVGNKYAGYIKIYSTLNTRFGDTWKAKAKGVCYHEYFHAIEASYDFQMANVWILEGCAVWAGCYYGKDWGHVKSYYDAAGSLFKVPNDVLWSSAYRKYSTSALVFFLSDKYAGHKFIKAYYDASVAQGDPMENLKARLVEKKTTFPEQYRIFWTCMYNKRIASIRKYMPDVAIAATHNAYGLDPTDGQVCLTGANIYLMQPQAGLKPAALIGVFETSASTPEGFLAIKQSAKPILFKDGKGFVKHFGGAVKEAAYIVTDGTYSGQDATQRAYEYSAIIPWIEITSIDAQSPIVSGDSSQIDVHYNLRGVYLTEDFPMQLKVIEKGPDVEDRVSGVYDIPAGEDRIFTMYFNTVSDTKGLYKFTFEFEVPPDDWDMPQVKSRKSCYVRVNAPTSVEGSVTSGRSGASLTVGR